MASVRPFFYVALRVKRLVVGNIKGGVGKTTVTVNLATALAEVYHRKVLVIDTDPGAGVSAQFGVHPQLALYDVLIEGVPPQEAFIHLADFGELFLLPSSKATQAIDFQLVSRIGRERVLEKCLSELDGFDYLLIDTPPSLSIITQNAFVYGREILIPISMDPMSLLGAASSIDLAVNIRDKLDTDCSIFGIVPTFFDSRLIVTRLVMQAIEERYADIPVLPTIRSDAAVRQSTASQIPLVKFEENSRAAEDFRKLALAVEERSYPHSKVVNQ